MPLGKQAAAYTLASSFAMVAAKCRMLLPDLFHFSFFLALALFFKFMIFLTFAFDVLEIIFY